METIVVMGLTFLVTAALLIFLLLWYVVRPVAEHMRENPEGAKALSEHVLVPLFGKKTAAEQQGLGVKQQQAPSGPDRK